MALKDLMIKPADPQYYDEKFRTVLEDHLTYFRQHPKTTINSIQAMHLHVYEFDFYGMLTEMGIPQELHWVTMRLAKLTAPTDDFKHLEILYVPDMDTINKRLQIHNTKSRVG